MGGNGGGVEVEPVLCLLFDLGADPWYLNGGGPWCLIWVPVLDLGSWCLGCGVLLGVPAHFTLMGSPSLQLLILSLANPQPASPPSLAPLQPPTASRTCIPSLGQNSGTTPRLEQVWEWREGA